MDEPPQFLNMLRGEMSFVGPRPVESGELRRYGMSAVIYQSLRPGVTSKWQVSGRSNVAYGKRVVLGVPYPKKMTRRGDIVILSKTLTPVAALTGR
ncbi:MULTISPECIES: sugar transferase [unclassified Sulfitobacter]|uniref:sugar transferase n=1 Tax=unclassified Sulfitobacter TaxID=196795 RepID=UPI003744EF89